MTTRVIRIDLQDALAFPSGAVRAAPKKGRIYLRAPAEWLDGAHLHGDRIETVLAQLYGPTWRQGNSDGSQYVVQSFLSRALDAAEEAAAPWLVPDAAVNLWFYRVGAGGSLEKVAASDLGAQEASAHEAPRDQVLDLLAQLARNEVSRERVVRALVEHPSWLAPRVLFASLEGPSFRPTLRDFSADTNIPPRRLVLFTGDAHAARATAAGARLGTYVEDASGMQVFSLLDAAHWDRVDVNPYDPPEQSFFFQASVFDQIKLWTDAIAVEKAIALATRPGAVGILPSMVARIRTFPGYQALLDDATKNMITMQGRWGLENAALLFTAPDGTQTFLAKLPETKRATIKTVTVGGERLFPHLLTQGVDGAVFNASGPGPTCPVPLAFCEKMAKPT